MPGSATVASAAGLLLAAAVDGGAISWLGASGRFLAFLGLALAFGAALFLAWVPGAVEVPRRPVLQALLLGAALHLAGVALLLRSTLDQTGLGLAGLADSAVGQTLLLRGLAGVGALAFAALALAPRNTARLTPAVAVALLTASAIGSARFGHASLAGLGGIATDAMHLLPAATWAGGLLVFLWLLARATEGSWTPDQVRLAGVRFGTAALVCLLLLWLAGIATAVAILGADGLRDPAAALGTSWGRALAGKTVLTLGMVAVAAVNRYGILEPTRERGLAASIQRAVARAAPGLRTLEPRGGGLRRLLRVEALLGIVVLALAGVLTSVSPPGPDLHQHAGALEVTGSGIAFHGVLTADPAPVVGGTSSLTLRLMTHGGAVVEGNTCGREPPLSCVTAIIGAGADGGETHALQPIGGGDWRVEGILWSAPGDVAITVHVSTAEVPDDPVPFALTVAANA